jgi:hypothetical protein
VISISKRNLVERIEDFRSSTLSDQEVRAKYFVGRTRSNKYPPGDSRGWKLPDARKRCRGDADWMARIVTCSYRAFDQRYIYWTEEMVDWPRSELAADVIGKDNICFVTRRQMLPGNVSYFFVTAYLPIDGVLRSDNKGGESVFPMLSYSDDLLQHSGSKTGRPNVADRMRQAFADSTKLEWTTSPRGDRERTFGVRDLLGYVYAVCYSPGYRHRYEDQVRVDFPRIPIPKTAAIFHDLATVGGILIDCHLLSGQASRLGGCGQWAGSDKLIESVSWSNETVWIDRARGSGFHGVAKAVWDFNIGAHQVCEKWLKDRKGRKLSKDDIEHYQKIIVALSETIRIMKEVDEIIDQHGGWPGAFQTEASDAPEEQPLLKVAEPPAPYGTSE